MILKVFALQAEALLKLERYEEAETALIDAPTFDRDACAKFYGSSGGAYLFMVRSLVDIASGRSVIDYPHEELSQIHLLSMAILQRSCPF